MIPLLVLLTFSISLVSSDQLCGPCKMVVEMAEHAFASQWMRNYLQLHCSSLVPSVVCDHGFTVTNEYLDLFHDDGLCSYHEMCHARRKGHHYRDTPTNSSLDEDTKNILLAKLNSVEDFSELSAKLVRSLLRRVTRTLKESLPLLDKELTMKFCKKL